MNPFPFSMHRAFFSRVLCLLALLGLLSATQFAAAQTVDERINAVVTPISSFLSGLIFASVPVAGTQVPLIVVWLAVAAVVCTLSFRFVNLWGFKHGIDLVRGRYGNDPDAPGMVTHYQALTTAVSGTVGLGNIAGVAVALSVGGPGATFWMILVGLLGMSTKFVECTLGVKYRRINPDGRVDGGPMFYLREGLADVGKAGLGRFMGLFYAGCMTLAALGGGNMFQSNQAVQQIILVTGGAGSPLAGSAWLVGLGLALVVGAVILGASAPSPRSRASSCLLWPRCTCCRCS